MALAKAEIMGRGQNQKKKKNCLKGGDGLQDAKLAPWLSLFYL